MVSLIARVLLALLVALGTVGASAHALGHVGDGLGSHSKHDKHHAGTVCEQCAAYGALDAPPCAHVALVAPVTRATQVIDRAAAPISTARAAIVRQRGPPAPAIA